MDQPAAKRSMQCDSMQCDSIRCNALDAMRWLGIGGATLIHPSFADIVALIAQSIGLAPSGGVGLVIHAQQLIQLPV